MNKDMFEYFIKEEGHKIEDMKLVRPNGTPSYILTDKGWKPFYTPEEFSDFIKYNNRDSSKIVYDDELRLKTNIFDYLIGEKHHSFQGKITRPDGTLSFKIVENNLIPIYTPEEFVRLKEYMGKTSQKSISEITIEHLCSK